MVGANIVDDALVLYLPFLNAVKGGGVVLIGDEHNVGVVGQEDLLCLSFVKLFKSFHLSNSFCNLASSAAIFSAISALYALNFFIISGYLIASI